MASRCRKYTTVYVPGVGRVRRCVSRSRSALSGLGEIGTLGQAAGMKGIFNEVKGTLVSGAVAVGGAALTGQVFKKIEASLGITDPLKVNLAMALTGVGIGVLVGKLLKKPKLGAMLAIGPVTLAGYNIFQQYFPTTSAIAPTAGVYALNPYPNAAMQYPWSGVGINAYGKTTFPYAAENQNAVAGAMY